MSSWQSDQSGWYNDPSGAGGPTSDPWAYNPGAQETSPYYTTPATNNPYDQSSGGFYSTPSGVGADGGMSSGGFYGGGQAPAQSYGGGVFYPEPTKAGESVDFEDEPPLLEELGINFEHIREKTLAVLNPLKKADASVIADQDLAGPLVFCLMFGGSLLLHGKVHFGYIYGIGVLGCLGMYALLNLMAIGGISLTCTVSVLGYCLLPMGLLSLISAVLSFKGIVGFVISVMAVLWCSSSAAKLFVTALDMDHQQVLVAYPCSLLYGVFALLAVF